MNKLLWALFALSALFGLISAQSCSWSVGVTCPISASSSPKCGIENPRKIDKNKYAVNICAAEKPQAFGGSFAVSHNFDGNILDIAEGYLSNCDKGDGVGTRAFITHCSCATHCSITGTWSVLFEGSSEQQSEEQILEKIKKMVISQQSPSSGNLQINDETQIEVSTQQ